MATGKIVTYFQERGFGFIHQPQEGGSFKAWFFHVNKCWCEPRVGMQVTFEESTGDKGLRAVNVREANVLGGGK